MDKKSPLLNNPQFVVLYIDALLNLWSWIEKADKLLEASKLLEPQLRAFLECRSY